MHLPEQKIINTDEHSLTVNLPSVPAIITPSPIPTYRKLFSELLVGLMSGVGFAIGTIGIVVGGIAYARRGPAEATAVSVITGTIYPTTAILFAFSNSLPLIGSEEQANLNRIMELRTSSHAACFLVGLAQNAGLFIFVNTAAEALYGEEIHPILRDYLYYDFLTHILLFLNNADIHVSILLREQYSILIREIAGLVFGAGLAVPLAIKSLYGTYFLPGIDFVQQAACFVTNSIYLQHQYKYFYVSRGWAQLKQDMKEYLKRGLPSTAIILGTATADMTLILFLARYPKFLPGYQMVALFILPLLVAQFVLESEITRTMVQYKKHPSRVLLSSTVVVMAFPFIPLIPLTSAPDFFATLISGDNNPDLRENIHQVLPYGLAGMFAEGLRSMFTGILRGYDDQKTPALINILMTWLFTVSAIGAVIGNAPLTTINLFRNIGAPLMVSAILAQRLYKRIQEDHRPHCAFLQNFTIFRRAQPEQNVAQAVQIVEEGKDQDKKAFFAI